MNIPSNITTLLIGVVLTLLSLWYGKNHGLLPVAASAEAGLVDDLFNTMMTVGFWLFLLVEGILLYMGFRYRRRRGDLEDGPPVHGNVPLEILWTAIPAVIVLVIGVYSFDVYKAQGGFDPEAALDPGVAAAQVALLPGSDSVSSMIESHHLKPAHHHMALGVGAFPQDEGRPADLRVDVMGLQYAWIFTYPDSGVTSGELHVPIDKEVQLTISAQDVLHAFWLPEFRLKQDAIPGRAAELRFKPEREGEYPIVCAELCGPFHGAMGAKIYVHNQQDYDNWLQSQIASKENSTETVALNPTDRTDADYLSPVASSLGITTEALSQLHSSHH